MKLKRFGGRVIGMAAVAVAAVASLLAAPAPAMADAYSPCIAVESNVTVGQTSKTQSITCVKKPACGESWGQIYDVTWNMVVYKGGITVKSMKITVTHTRGEDIVLGDKIIRGGSGEINIAPGKTIVPAAQTSFTKTFDFTDKYFAKNSLGFVDFWMAISSTKANGCNGGGNWLRYGLKIV
ncbi:hypothetical protein AB0J80_22625 [Actinoplanes sp. NPDC049548]|uniref:hypothetical protein n=1 Tax=Actinoplanes sp. NPDC049548 TaxID=3155152 RepID=UPI00343F5A8A